VRPVVVPQPRAGRGGRDRKRREGARHGAGARALQGQGGLARWLFGAV
ncbi:MAG: hypothetical protein AVDCRST_MAG05-1944, partial [uncultured Rubrobacteraceae bacterium]